MSLADGASPWPDAHVVIAGVGVSGFAAADGLLQLGARVTVLDDAATEANADKGALLEVLGAAGLVVPLATGIWPWLTPLAAVGLGVLMVGAITTHLRFREYPNALAPLAVLLLAAFVAYGRVSVVPAS